MLRIFIPFWNAGKYLERCLTSVLSQNEQDWTAHVFDDCSSDISAQIAEEFARTDSRVSLIVNRTKQWQSGNLWRFSRDPSVKNSDIVVQLDGDDWFPDRAVLSRIRAAYRSHDELLLTYGNFVRHIDGRLGAEGYCREPADFDILRRLPWTTSALKTHAMGLLRAVSRRDFQDSDGKFLSTVADLATGFPMLEMAGPRRSICLRDINYVYNMDNPVRTPVLQRSEQEQNAAIVRARAPYPRLTDAQVGSLLVSDQLSFHSLFKGDCDR